MDVDTGKGTLVGDSAKDRGGSGNYPAPFDLVCSGFACCLNTNARKVLLEKQIAYDKVITKVDGDRCDNKVEYQYSIEIIAPKATEEQRAACVAEAFKRSGIRKVLSSEVSFKQV